LIPGGGGPMAIAMLMKNTLQAARQIGACIDFTMKILL